MTDTTPEAAHLNFTKLSANEQLIRAFNGLTTNALRKYPEAEVESWLIQKDQAEAIVKAGANATLAMAPFIAGVCAFHFGEANTTVRLQQVKVKAAAIKANADNWAVVSQFVGGARARAQDQIEAATDAVSVSQVLDAARAEIEAFRIQAGI